MSFFGPSSPPKTRLGLHQILSSTAAVKVSPLALGGISIGDSWSSVFGKNEEAFKLLDAYFEEGGNFIDTSNVYNSEDSERRIGDWMHERDVRDQMVIATKYTAGYKFYDRERLPFQSNYTGNSAKSMHISVRDSLKKLRTDYIDILFVHWWDFGTSVEEVMKHLHALVLARQVLYLGISDTPAWVVVKANAFAKANGLTPFSVYQGKWNAAFRDMEAEIIPMCQDQGMAIMPWAALGGGQLLSAEQREKLKEDGNASGRQANITEKNIRVSNALEKLATAKNTTLQAVALAYLISQSPYVVPLVGVQTVEHVTAMSATLDIRLTDEDVKSIHEASPFDPLFPMSFLFNFRGEQPYHLGLTERDNQQYQMAARIGGPPKQRPY
ncbi:hypothetical protein M409DRAFT_64103 [Zasmidium cellare ATCC 36951]|uniref:NADP-dependent oxidoreductase domain-containing protein n=1 Tax=Zasmidium cellare ATCC 36951 TaxID=1080233 RepID=A0A6A6CVT7_ZASCE|nr:uncharacterized protein M409DRAFT_64103 [Zasmidium cellare ATCC 36951]KAF2170318.1 hypothetical protein M409DRAFT_64103 [Zasmidium cellare ATCC 36951]